MSRFNFSGGHNGIPAAVNTAWSPYYGLGTIAPYYGMPIVQSDKNGNWTCEYCKRYNKAELDSCKGCGAPHMEGQRG